MWTSGSAAMERPVCVLIHWLVTANVLVLVATQAFIQFTTGRTEAYSLTWVIISIAAIIVHVAFGFIHAWLAGDPILFGGRGGGSDGGGFGSGDADNGSGGDGGGGDGGSP